MLTHERHSSMCDFYRKLNRCKFGAFCSAVRTSKKDELDNVNERVTSLKKLLVKNEEHIEESKVNYIEEEYTNINLERKMRFFAIQQTSFMSLVQILLSKM